MRYDHMDWKEINPTLTERKTYYNDKRFSYFRLSGQEGDLPDHQNWIIGYSIDRSTKAVKTPKRVTFCLVLNHI